MAAAPASPKKKNVPKKFKVPEKFKGIMDKIATCKVTLRRIKGDVINNKESDVSNSKDVEFSDAITAFCTCECKKFCTDTVKIGELETSLLEILTK